MKIVIYNKKYRLRIKLHVKPSVEKRDFRQNPWVLARKPCKKVIVWELRNETFRDWE